MAAKESFEVYYNTYYKQAFLYTLKKITNYDDAEDLTMDAFAACWKNFDTFDPSKASFKTWLYFILNNKIKNYYRDSKDCDDIDELNVEDDSFFEGKVEMNEYRNVLAEALKTLNEIQRKIVIYTYYNDMTSAEVADQLGMSAINVRVTLSRTLKKLQTYFEERNIRWEV